MAIYVAGKLARHPLFDGVATTLAASGSHTARMDIP
jgi:hypothetical protein